MLWASLLNINDFFCNLDLPIPRSSSSQTLVAVFCLTAKSYAFYPHLLADEDVGFQLVFPRIKISAINLKKQFCHNFAEDVIFFLQNSILLIEFLLWNLISFSPLGHFCDTINFNLFKRDSPHVLFRNSANF